MKRSLAVTIAFFLFITILFVNGNSVSAIENVKLSENPVETYALLFDQFPFDVNGTTVCSAIEIKDSLLDLGWSMDNISIFLGEENLTDTIILEQLNFLEQEVDENDLVFVYITAHGHTYCRDVLDFNSWFQLEYNQIGTSNRIFLMDSCYGGEFVRNFYDEGYAMSSVGEYEVAIALFPEQNGTWQLSEPPFSGAISSHFWAKSITNIDADTSSDGVVSLSEMFDFSLPDIRECYNETFEAYPDMASYVQMIAGYTEFYPAPLVVNNLNYDLTLNATDYIFHNDKYTMLEEDAKPIINCENVMFYSEESSVNVFFEISDYSDFDYYCYVDGTVEKWGSHAATGSNFWSYMFTLQINSKVNYNVSMFVEDIWGNINVNFTLVKYDGPTETTSFNLSIPLVLLLSVYIGVISHTSKKRKD